MHQNSNKIKRVILWKDTLLYKTDGLSNETTLFAWNTRTDHYHWQSVTAQCMWLQLIPVSFSNNIPNFVQNFASSRLTTKAWVTNQMLSLQTSLWILLRTFKLCNELENFRTTLTTFEFDKSHCWPRWQKLLGLCPFSFKNYILFLIILMKI